MQLPLKKKHYIIDDFLFFLIRIQIFHPAVSLGTATDLTKANVVLNTVVTMFAEPPG